MKRVEKHITISSAILISAATIGFLVIPFFFENKITELKEKNNEIIETQKSVYDILLKANDLNDKFHDIKDQIDIMTLLHINKNDIKTKLSRVLSMRYESALFYLNAANVTKTISVDEHDSAKRMLDNFKTEQEYQLFYQKYFAIATEQTTLIDGKRKENQKVIDELIHQKNVLWYVSLALQSLGMILALVVLYIKKGS
jgi:galactitol-specific phosphotransferase system IIB component